MNKEGIKEAIVKYEQFKKSEVYDEKYKWDYIKKNRGIFDNLDNLAQKLKDLGSPNIVPFVWKQSMFKYLVDNHEHKFKIILSELFDESKNIASRVNNFSKAITEILSNDPQWKNKKMVDPGVESASFFLFLKNPNKYLLFTKRTEFKEFAKKQGLSKELLDTSDNGNRYEAWLSFCRDIIIPIMDEVLGRPNTLLDCQDLIYCQTGYNENFGKMYTCKNNKPSQKELNLILYGPPGTGKTFITKEKSIDIIEGGKK